MWRRITILFTNFRPLIRRPKTRLTVDQKLEVHIPSIECVIYGLKKNHVVSGITKDSYAEEGAYFVRSTAAKKIRDQNPATDIFVICC